jgi:hypothetical protein
VCLTTPAVRNGRTIGDLGEFEMVTECAIFHSNRYHSGEPANTVWASFATNLGASPATPLFGMRTKL